MPRFGKHTDIILSLAVVGIIAILIIPVPAGMLDSLLAVNITFALLILLVTLYLKRPLDFSVFPGLLLIVTLFRLSLNVASTRLILGDAYAGAVIDSFGNFVVKGNYVVGLIIFLILVVIQFVVITKGAGRISEVAARFTLDAMPGKQMAIDADLNAGLIDEAEARQRRSDITREADFYGAMDGASKFVRGDAIAGILITLINIVGGFVIGIAQQGMSFSEALRTYTLLTVGDGLVTQIPALVIATSAGILVTRAAGDTNLSDEIKDQLTVKPRILIVASGLVFALGVVPGMPMGPFTFLSILIGGIAYVMLQTERKERLKREAAEEQVRITPEEQRTPTEQAMDSLRLDTLEVEIGYGLIPLVDTQQGGDLLERVSSIRKQLALELGLIVPPIRIRDNVQLKPNLYEIKLKGVRVAGFELMVDHLMAINPGDIEDDLEGFKTAEPAFGMKAKWIIQNYKELAEMKGFTVVEPSAVMATHLTEVIKSHSPELLTRQDVRNLLERVKQESPASVEDVVPEMISLSALQKVLQNLLSERVSIRDLVTILEVLADYGSQIQEPDLLTEYVRISLRRKISDSYKSDDNKINVFTLDPTTEKLLTDSVQATKQGLLLVLPPETGGQLTEQLKLAAERMAQHGKAPIVLVSPNTRLALRRYVRSVIPNLVVLSYSEVTPDIEVYSVEIVGLGHDN